MYACMCVCVCVCVCVCRYIYNQICPITITASSLFKVHVPYASPPLPLSASPPPPAHTSMCMYTYE